MVSLTVPCYWHRSINFGDNIGPYLIEKITGRKPVYNEDKSIRTLFVVGSILSEANESSVIWGSGFAWNDTTNEPVKKPGLIALVRGVKTREKYLKSGIDCPANYGDPALLLPEYYHPQVEVKHELGIIPHIIDYERAKKLHPDSFVIDLRKPVEEVIIDILSCERTVSSSLHGLIVSHAYGIPSAWVEYSKNVLGNGFKFRDYLETYGYKNIEPDKPNTNYKYYTVNADTKPIYNTLHYVLESL